MIYKIFAQSASRLTDAVVLCVIALLVTVTYGLQITGFDFVLLDDNRYVYENPIVRSGLTSQGLWWALSALEVGNWHPLTWISHMLVVEYFGMEPAAHHLANLILHTFNAALVYLLAVKLINNRMAAGLVAVLFAIHPMNVEVVSWVSQRKDVLAAFFFLLSLLSYIRYQDHRRSGAYWLALVFYVLAAAAKPMVVTVPVILLLLDFWPSRRVDDAAGSFLVRAIPYVREKIPFFIISLLLAGLTVWAQKTSGAVATLDAVPLVDRLMNAVVSYRFYLSHTLLPGDLAVLYPLQQIDLIKDFLPSLGLLLLISGACIGLFPRAPCWLLGWLWFLVMLVPVIGLIQVGQQSYADRYFYLPSLGLFFAIAMQLVAREWLGRTITVIIALLLILFFGALTFIQAGYWRNSETLFLRALHVTQKNHVAYANLAAYYGSIGRLQDAEIAARSSLDIEPRKPYAYATLGNIRLSQQQYAQAEEFYRRAIAITPNDASLLNNLGVVLLRQNKTDQAIEIFLDATRGGPPTAQPLFNLALLYEQLGQPSTAKAWLIKGLAMDQSQGWVPDKLKLLAEQERLHTD